MRKIIVDALRAVALLMPIGVYGLVCLGVSPWWIFGFVLFALVLTNEIAEEAERTLYLFLVAGLGVLIAGYNMLRPVPDSRIVFLVLSAMFIQCVMLVMKMLPARKE